MFFSKATIAAIMLLSGVDAKLRGMGRSLEGSLKEPYTCKATAWGDPHIVTFDGLKFDAQTKGEAILLNQTTSELQVQAIFEKIDVGGHWNPAVTTALAIQGNMSGQPRIQVSMATASDPHAAGSSYTNFIDTQIWKKEADSSFGNDHSITVDKDDDGHNVQALLKVPDLEIADVERLEKAVLTFYSNNPSGDKITAYRMTQNWDEWSTWNSFGSDGIVPGQQAASTSSFNFSNPGTHEVIEMDVTNDIIFWSKGNLNQGWVLINDGDDGWDFDTVDSGNGPKLDLIYSTDSCTFSNDIAYTTMEETMIWEKLRDTVYEPHDTISIDQDDSGKPTQGLVKIPDLEPIPEGKTLKSAILSFYTVNPTEGTISGYRMNTGWNGNSTTWSSFGDGVEPGNQAEDTASFTIAKPRSKHHVSVDVTEDVKHWLNGNANEGWVLINSSGDGWDFKTSYSGSGPRLDLILDNGVEVINGCPVSLYVNGTRQNGIDHNSTAEKGALVTLKNDIISVVFPKVLRVDMSVHTFGKCHFSSDVTLLDCESASDNVIGLLGSPNGDASDDWMDEYGEPYTAPEDPYFRQAFEYTKLNWMNYNQNKSLFAYKDCRTSDEFAEPEEEYDEEFEETLLTKVSDEVKEICGDDVACLVDGLLGKDAAIDYKNEPASSRTVVINLEDEDEFICEEII